MSWSYTGHDPGISLFDACLTAGAPMPIADGDRILEIGCAEADWLSLAAQAWPGVQFAGIDTRAKDTVDGLVERKRADVRQSDLCAPETFDGIVSLSAIEHVGLGHYKDPIDPDGDSAAIANAWRWLKPGGWLYFDVPFDPTGYRVQGTKCRIYDDEALWTRLWVEPLVRVKGRAQQVWRGYVHEKTPRELLASPPTERTDQVLVFGASVAEMLTNNHRRLPNAVV